MNAKQMKGSPPRMRGKGLMGYRGRSPCGITPAYAGKSKIDDVEISKKEGSPPRMRGKAAEGSILDYMGRITPAYAGKSRSRLSG